MNFPYKIKMLKSSFKSREHSQKKEHVPYFEVSATQASSVALTISRSERQGKQTLI